MTLLAAMLGLTVALLVLAGFALRPDPVATRLLRYAGVADAPVQRPQWRLPRALEAYMLQAGVEPEPGPVLLVLNAHMLAGLLAGALLHAPLAGLAAGGLAYILRLRLGRAARVARLAGQLPDALMLMASAIRAGLGFQQALQLVGREGPAPLAGEFHRLERDLGLGLPIEEALGRLQTRLASTDAEMLVAALLVQRQTGGNLSEILLALHDTIRDRQALHGQIRTLTAQGRLSGVILCCLPLVLGLGLWVLNRGYVLLLLTDPRGQLMAIAALLLMAVGSFVISRIVKIEL